MATAADLVVVEPYESVDVIDPENVITPYPFVDYILVGEDNE
jgi:acyl CoA:acetate/3-ketoacid CoA transferase alpha subunit